MLTTMIGAALLLSVLSLPNDARANARLHRVVVVNSLEEVPEIAPAILVLYRSGAIADMRSILDEPKATVRQYLLGRAVRGKFEVILVLIVRDDDTKWEAVTRAVELIKSAAPFGMRLTIYVR